MKKLTKSTAAIIAITIVSGDNLAINTEAVDFKKIEEHALCKVIDTASR
jgi:hypothetical protein